MKLRDGCSTERGFTLIELLVVIAIVVVLAALLFPVLGQSKTRAVVTRVQSDLRQAAIAIEMYQEDWRGLPPVRSCCSGSERWDYYELPHELVTLHYLGIQRFSDPFNQTAGDDGQTARPYKYLAVNWGYSANHKTHFTMWIPRDYPACNQSSLLYYEFAGRIYALDGGETRPQDPPIRWAVWSVGPSGDPGLEETGNRQLPAPRKEWYPLSRKGVIVRFADGRMSR
ncbi:MAG: prepilin-type N-terminal cleavage/methylation domain-containing protein [Armatimonadetes bacterium]|nr:prepilin-type N-terminal cleavage/methylation domain-containing protein [Armatimonadota bacterium]